MLIEENIRKIKDRIAQVSQKAGRNPNEIRLVCVTKEADVGQIKEAIQAGITEIGENRVQDALKKYNYFTRHLTPNTKHLTPIKWHMVGHLQTNKVKSAIKIFDLIHSVDSFRLAEETNRQATKLNKTIDILVQVNTSGEKTKFGILQDKVLELVEQIINLSNLRLQGLMTVAPLVKEPEETRPYFQKLRLLKNEINKYLLSTRPVRKSLTSNGARYSLLATLSMGMSGDFEVAIEEGANMIRLGRAIFG